MTSVLIEMEDLMVRDGPLCDAHSFPLIVSLLLPFPLPPYLTPSLSLVQDTDYLLLDLVHLLFDVIEKVTVSLLSTTLASVYVT